MEVKLVFFCNLAASKNIVLVTQLSSVNQVNSASHESILTNLNSILNIVDCFEPFFSLVARVMIRKRVMIHREL